MRKTLVVLISLIFILAACAPGQSPEQVQGQVNTAVAQTMAARQQIQDAVALTVAAQNQSLPTATDTPTPTSTPIGFPTLTPVIATVTPLPVHPPSGGGGGGGVPAKADYSCDVIHQRPYDNSEFRSGDKFDVKWTIVNSGTKTWRAGVDVKYLSGPQMTSVTLVQIPTALGPGDEYDIWLDAVTPDDTGFQVMTWVVEGRYCYPYVAIIVK